MKKTKTPKALRTNILKTLKKEQIIIVAIVLAFLLLLTGFGVFRYIVYPNLKVQEISQSTVDLKDIDFLYSVTHNTANGASGVEVTGTYLESAQQADIYVTTMDNDKKSEGIRFLIDKDQMYVDTRNLFQATGKYWLGDMNSDEYFEKMYDEIFSSDITNIDMNTYGCRIWNGGSPWLHELLQLSSILKNEADNTILNSLHYSGGGDVFTAKVDTDKLVDGLTTFYENLKSNEDYYKDDVANIILSYGNEVKGYSGIFGQTMGVWADETSQSIKDGDAEDVQLFQDVYQFLTELITNCRKNDATMTHNIRKTNEDVINNCTIDCGNDETYVLQYEIRPSFHTYVEDIPEKYETFATQLALLEAAYDTVLDPDVEVIKEELDKAEQENATANASDSADTETLDEAGSANEESSANQSDATSED